MTPLAEIDYIVMVPNALTEAQMTSLYSTYSQGADIETFLSDNSLTPTVKYTFENDNTNTGTATGLPAISFQATDTYSAESIEKYQVWMYMLSPDGVGGAGDHNVLTNIFMYDTHDAWPGSGGINTENGNRLSYTIDESSWYSSANNAGIKPPDALLSSGGLTHYAYHYDTVASETVPIMKMSNVDT